MNSKQNTNTAILGIIAGAIMAIMAIRSLTAGTIAFRILNLAGYGIIAFSLFTKRRDIVPVAGFGILTFSEIIATIIMAFSYFRYIPPLWYFTCLIRILGFVSMLAVAVIMLTNYLPNLKNYAKKLWFLPAAICGFAAIFGGGRGIYLFFNILMAVGFLIAAMWSVNPEEADEEQHYTGSQNVGTGTATATPGKASDAMPQDSGYMDLVTHILLLLFTLGIWQLIWIYKTTRYLNRVDGEEYRNPTNQLLLCMFIPFYSIYWVYKSAQRLEKLSAQNGIQTELATICLILAIFVGVIPPILIQDGINKVSKIETGAAKPDEPIYAQNTQSTQNTAYKAPAQPATAEANRTNMDAVEELKAFKDLLDIGAITQEEYDKKKSEILNS